MRLFFIVFFLSSHALAEQPYIAVGKAKTKKTIMAIDRVVLKNKAPSLDASAKTLTKTIKSDLLFMDLFRFLSESSLPSRAGTANSQIRFPEWIATGAELLLISSLEGSGSNLTYEVYLYDVLRGKQLFAKRYAASKKDVKRLGHTVAGDIVEKLTGLPGIFLTKIAMSCDRTGKKEIYIMDFDGTNVKKITDHRSIAFAPAWSPDGNRLAYSVYTRRRNHQKNIDLFQFDFRTNKIRMLSNRKGINSGAAFHPTNGRIALTMSFLGNPEVFSLDPRNKNVTRLTKSFGFDVDPTWSPDGSKLAFVSSRAGKPMVYRMNADGTATTRLTYAGRLNATPSWSPQDNKIAFAGWKNGRFEIFTMNPDGTKIERLTKGQGNNEDPSFSPDGNFIVFSSNRTGKKNVYAMNLDGTFVRRMTYGLGNCVAPKWSNPPRP